MPFLLFFCFCLTSVLLLSCFSLLLFSILMFPAPTLNEPPACLPACMPACVLNEPMNLLRALQCQVSVDINGYGVHCYLCDDWVIIDPSEVAKNQLLGTTRVLFRAAQQCVSLLLLHLKLYALHFTLCVCVSIFVSFFLHLSCLLSFFLSFFHFYFVIAPEAHIVLQLMLVSFRISSVCAQVMCPM